MLLVFVFMLIFCGRGRASGVGVVRWRVGHLVGEEEVRGVLCQCAMVGWTGVVVVVGGVLCVVRCDCVVA